MINSTNDQMDNSANNLFSTYEDTNRIALSNIIIPGKFYVLEDEEGNESPRFKNDNFDWTIPNSPTEICENKNNKKTPLKTREASNLTNEIKIMIDVSSLKQQADQVNDSTQAESGFQKFLDSLLTESHFDQIKIKPSDNIKFLEKTDNNLENPKSAIFNLKFESKNKFAGLRSL